MPVPVTDGNGNPLNSDEIMDQRAADAAQDVHDAVAQIPTRDAEGNPLDTGELLDQRGEDFNKDMASMGDFLKSIGPNLMQSGKDFMGAINAGMNGVREDVENKIDEWQEGADKRQAENAEKGKDIIEKGWFDGPNA